jgi:hypothetical protein
MEAMSSILKIGKGEERRNLSGKVLLVEETGVPGENLIPTKVRYICQMYR